MVVFTCNNCGDSLQKPKVEKHYQTACRSSKNLTCVDCLSDFRGEDYQAHIKCMTEDERYAAKGSMQIGVAKKGELKQQSWIEVVNGIVEKEPNLPMHVKRIFDNLKGFNNVPRKKGKFMNFNKSNLGRYFYEPHVEQVWELMEKHKQERFAKKDESNTKEKNGTKTELGNGEVKCANENLAQDTCNGLKKTKNSKEIESDVPTKKKKKHSKNNEQVITNNEENGLFQNEDGKFSFEEEILKILHTKKQLSAKKLQKKVLNAYVKHRAMDTFTEKHVKKYNKQLNKMPNIHIQDDLVQLA